MSWTPVEPFWRSLNLLGLPQILFNASRYFKRDPPRPLDCTTYRAYGRDGVWTLVRMEFRMPKVS
ncbi:hypothetical protein PsorP6_019469 [Peronosclerospora sorghi]|nr:hypothetical protein PsorP6_019352 [Peronosclerospora sorghi]KAI9895363.1 hypothetical protein PsorP6_019469 [Peronosclerospora sorghi]